MIRMNKIIAILVLAATSPTFCSAEEFRFADGDRVVLLGDALIEQEQYFGWVEVMFTATHADRNVSFKNLGWSGDTPAGQSRFGLSLMQAGRAPANEGWKQLVKQLELTKPTVVVFGYGMASGIENAEVGTTQFRKDFQRLIDKAKEVSPNVRFLFLTPIAPTDSAMKYADSVKAHAEVIKVLAAETDSPVVDLAKIGISPEHRKDAIHLNDSGYREAAQAIQSSLGWENVEWQKNAAVKSLRDVILRKNTWWFHRSRPANMAYVFGFRKHEQGQNAVEIPKFDALIAKEEKLIGSLRSLQPSELPKAEPTKKSQYAKFTPQPTPEFTVADGLEISLWAENPLLNKPIQMNFDPQGRLWVASSEAYPMIEVGQAAPDRILILEDSTGDGKADRSTVFAEDLLIPTGVIPGDGGCYVAQSTDLLFLKDTDGDGKADQKTRVLSGFGTEDTHHNLHTLHWGPDGRLYMNQSIYTRTDAETPHGIVRLKAGGGFRYDTQTMQAEVFFRGLVNSWGHQFDSHGQSFLTDGAGFNGIAYSFPGATFRPVPGARQTLGLISPGRYPKFCAMEIINGDTFPAEWHDTIVTCDFRANRVTRFSLADDGAGFVTKQESDLCRTSAATFRPIDVKQGPDGALYIADWSNPIINHGEVDFRDPRRDRWHGRIWRIATKSADPKRKQDLTKLSNQKLLDNLQSDDRYTRDQSRRVLIHRSESSEVTDAAAAWIANQTAPKFKLQGLWLAQALKLKTDPVLQQLLTDSDARIRAAAVRVLGNTSTQGDVALKLCRQAIADSNPRVRLEAIRAAAKIGGVESAQVALQATEQPRDRFIDHALFLTINEQSTQLMQAITSGDWEPSDAQLETVLTAIPSAQATQFVAKHLAEFGIPKDGKGPWIELVAKTGSPAELKTLYQQVLNDGFDRDATLRVLKSLQEAQRLRKIRPAGGAAGISKLLNGSDPLITKSAIELSGLWKLRGQVGTLGKTIADPKKTLDVRTAAVYALRSIGGPESANSLYQTATKSDAGALRKHAVISLARLDIGRAASPFFELLNQVETEQQGLELWRGVMVDKRAGKTLAKKIGDVKITETAARAGIRVAREAGRKEPELVAALNPLTGINMTAKKMTPQEMAALSARVAKEGDPHRGEDIYRRKELACISCHAIGGVGGKVGPDMTSLGASAPTDYITQSLFDPNAKIKENYHSVIVATDDGTVSGIEVSSTNEEMVLRDSTGKLIKIAMDSVLGKKNGPSLMPSGVIDRLSRAEQIDLISFLTKLGKPGDFDASKANVGRVYEIFAGTHRIEQQGAELITSGKRTEGWKPLTSRVSGAITKQTMEEMTRQPVNIGLVNVYLRTEVQATAAGDATFTVEGPAKSALWVNGKRVKGESIFKAKLAAGKSTILVRLDPRALPDNFKLKSSDVSFSFE